jgi:hypothetical protein
MLLVYLCMPLYSKIIGEHPQGENPSHISFFHKYPWTGIYVYRYILYIYDMWKWHIPNLFPTFTIVCYCPAVFLSHLPPLRCFWFTQYSHLQESRSSENMGFTGDLYGIHMDILYGIYMDSTFFWIKLVFKVRRCKWVEFQLDIARIYWIHPLLEIPGMSHDRLVHDRKDIQSHQSMTQFSIGKRFKK